MSLSFFGYTLDGSVVDITTWIVAIVSIPVSLAWQCLRTWWMNKKPSNANQQIPYPTLTWDNAIGLFVSGSGLVPLGFLVLGSMSHTALNDLLEASRYTMALGGTIGLGFCLRDVFR